ncbi:MAG: hypothetical protein J6S67_12335 [Methanobrevibacter sp.]|nr:hypothetical protein [Methanobrevibacter sp.]
MANVWEVTNALLDSANAVSNTYNDYITKEAKLSTDTKQNQLKADINAQMDAIRRSSSSEEWPTKINEFFEKTKSDMENPDSVYYCKNRKQAEMFNSILNEAKVDVDSKVSGLVYEADREKAIVNYKNSLTLLSQTEGGQGYIDKANNLARDLFECGYITREQYQTQLDTNFNTAYINTATKAFDDTIEESIRRGDSKEKVINMALDNVTNLMGIDTDGLPKTFDKDTMNKTLENSFKAKYGAYLADYQQQNANKLSEINQQMRQASTAEGRLAIARRGQQALSGMTGNMISEDDRNKYAAYFDLGNGTKSSGSGSGSGTNKPTDAYEKLIDAAPGEALELIKTNPELCPYDAAEIYSMKLTKWFMTEDYKENYDKDMQDRSETFDRLYEHRTSKESIADGIFKEIKNQFPTLAGYIDNKAKGLQDYIKKNPKSFSQEDLAQVSAWCVDWALSANGNATDADFKKDFDNMVNTFYVSSVKSVTLNDRGKLKQTFNANKTSDIAQAAKIAADNDFVFTDQYGEASWAPGKKEALEAEGGIVNVLQNAVVGTLGLSENDYKDIGFYYQPDESGNDMTSKPIVTYKDKAYEVIPDEKGKGFNIRDINTGEIIEGKAGGKLKKVMRANQKQEAEEDVKQTSREVAQLKKDREKQTNEAITASTNYPKAMQAAGKVDKDTWNDYKDLETRTYNLRVTANRMDADAKKMDDAEFKKKYNISKDEWTEDKVESRRFNLILKS